MLNLKNIIATIAALSSSIAFADEVITTKANSAWELGVAALYLQPSLAGNGLGYSSYSNYAGADNSGKIVTFNGPNRINNVTPQWDFGFALEGAYFFCQSNDVNLNWNHLHEHVDGHLPHGSLFSGSADGFYAGNLELATKWDAVNIEVGKHINFSDRKLLRLHAGMQFARIKNTFTNHPKLFIDSSEYFTSHDELSYSGLGPRFGADFEYVVDHACSLYAKAAGSILVGSAKQNISGYRDYTNVLYGLIPFGIPNYHFSNHNVVVPEFEAKLGIAYGYQFARSHLGIDFGYQWMNYLDAILSYTGIGIVGSSIGIPKSSNFNLNGVHLGFTWKGDL